MRLNQFLLLFVISLNFSCATLFNRKEVKISIQAPKDTKITIDSVSKIVENEKLIFNAKRSKDSLQIKLENDNTSYEHKLKSKNSFMFYYNFFHNYGIGALIDLTNDKRFTYKRKLAFEYDSISNSFIETKYNSHYFKKNDLLVYTSPIAAIDLFSQPMLTLGIEYFVTRNLSLSAELGFSYFNPRKTDVEVIPYKGNLQRFEVKFHNLINLFNLENDSEYIGLEARFIQRQFSDDINYNFIDNPLEEEIFENIAVKRNLNIYNLKYGFILPLNDHFYFDIYTGFGVRIADVINPGIQYNRDIHFLTTDEFFFSTTYENLEDSFTKSQFNFSLGFKFGYRF